MAPPRSSQRSDSAEGPIWEGDWTAACAAALSPAIAAAVRGPGGPTAVVVANDQMALGLIAGLRSAGVEVPGDVSIAGFDDNPDAAYYRPALTTVRVDIAGEARRCVAEVLGLEASASPVTEPVLVVRASTAPPPGAPPPEPIAVTSSGGTGVDNA